MRGLPPIVRRVSHVTPLADLRAFLSNVKKAFVVVRDALDGLQNALYELVLHFFTAVNHIIRSRLPAVAMEIETMKHVHMTIKVFKWVIVPLSLVYVATNLYFFKHNAFDSMLWGLLVFFYSSFVPDLPSIFRAERLTGQLGDLHWWQKCAVLYGAPIFICALFSGFRLGWKTTETFHNFRSLVAYVAFLLVLGFLAFGDFAISLGDLTEILSVPLYGAIGYLTHLKVDEQW